MRTLVCIIFCFACTKEKYSGDGKDGLTFDKLSEKYISGGSFTEIEILENVKGEKEGYTIKEIKDLNPSGLATLSNDKKNITFTKIGGFTATLVLEHDKKEEVIIENADFEIEKMSPETLTFDELSEKYVSGGSFTEIEILANVKGQKQGYSIKEIKDLNPAELATISNDKKSITFTKTGNFTATLVLEHDKKEEVIIENADFEIEKVSPETLTFDELSEKYISGGSFTEIEILANVKGKKQGYSIKEIKNLNPSVVVNLSNDKKSMSFIKPGNFEATLLLQHNYKKDAIIISAKFDIYIIYKGLTYKTVNSKSGRVWLDRNLGAYQKCTSDKDLLCYGDYFQFGRKYNGHERDGATNGFSKWRAFNTHGDNPNSHVSGQIVREVSTGGRFQIPQHHWYSTTSPKDKTTGYDLGTNSFGNFWNDAYSNSIHSKGGAHNPCPKFFRVPTKDEWEIEKNTNGWTLSAPLNPELILNSPLSLPMAGYRSGGGPVYDRGLEGRYWSNTPYSGVSTSAHNLVFGLLKKVKSDDYFSRSNGFSVRCIED